MNKQEIIKKFEELGYTYFADGLIKSFKKSEDSWGQILRIMFTWAPKINNENEMDYYIHSYNEDGEPIGLTIEEAELAVEFAKILRKEREGE